MTLPRAPYTVCFTVRPSLAVGVPAEKIRGDRTSIAWLAVLGAAASSLDSCSFACFSFFLAAAALPAGGNQKVAVSPRQAEQL
jgi:hypothetical protein